MKIWLIDDDKIQHIVNKRTVKRVVPDAVIKIYEGASKALEDLMSGNKPDLLFLDLNMPIMSGFDFLDRTREQGIDVNVIVLSSSIDPADIERSYGYANVVSYVTKAISVDKVKQYLR